ncbi:MAG: hypothetical protein K6F92_09925 [Lachnospiraceae bacterium]|nr:hypothetical protein [Lachnospiraceae bacterium]
MGKGKNRSVKFTFNDYPKTLAELQALPEADLNTAFKTTALVCITLMNYEQNPEETLKMLDFLNGPNSVEGHERQFIKEYLGPKMYKIRSFFEGSTPENDYTPNKPYVITVKENPYSFDNEDWATLWVKSSGADSDRQIILRRKPSTNQWFYTEIQILGDIRTPVSDNPWA